jgi:hypothetical protein|tara:strand:+ start:308 stop:541 length:234 start_codon:yes stop_codon:yes gene_type:complete
MKAILLGLALIAGAIVVDTEQLKSDLSEIERDAMALELYLQDKQDHEGYCPHISWSQPPLSTYKETLVSHLPEGCKQ